MGGRVATMTNDSDPRPRYRTALAWVRDLAAHVPADRFAAPTPDPEWDVRTLLGHILATVGRARVIGEAGDPTTEPSIVTGVDDGGWVDALTAAEEKRVVGHVIRREIPSMSDTVGRFTWKS